MSVDDPKLKSQVEDEGHVGFPQISSLLNERLQKHQDDDPGIDLIPEEGESSEESVPDHGDLRYGLSGELGRGGMGVVFKVYDADLRRNLAMKVLRLGTAGSSTQGPGTAEQQVVRRFLEEAQVTGQLDHPGIVPLHELGVDPDGRMYFTMRVVRGDDLSKIVEGMRKGESDWTLNQVVASMLKVCDAMSFAHAKGVIHRDLKPANIMAGQFGEVYVMDWGLAKVLGRDDTRDLRPDLEASQYYTAVHTEREDSSEEDGFVTMEGTVCGTPAYMSPEQARGRVNDLDGRSDIYSLGAILYHVLTGYAPYQQDGARIAGHMVLKWAIEGPPKPVREVAPGASRELAAICDKAMARDPEDRYSNMRELQADLRRYLRGRPVHALQLGLVQNALLWSKKNPIAMGLLAAVLAACGAGLWIMNSLSTDLVHQAVTSGAATQARMLERVNSLYTSEVVGRLRGHVDITHAYVDREAAIPIPATFLTTLADRLTATHPDEVVRHYSDYPFAFRSDGGPRDDFERAALVRLRANPDEPVIEFTEANGHPVLRYATARILEPSCVECHNTHPDSTKTDWKAGDVRGVLSIQRPLEEQLARTQRGLRGTFLLVGAIATMLLLLVAWGVIRIRRSEPAA